MLPKSKLSEALTYALNHKEEFMNYLKDGNGSLSNNLAENSIRPFTIDRKNWLFSGSPKGASASATVYSIIESGMQFTRILLFFYPPSYLPLTVHRRISLIITQTIKQI